MKKIILLILGLFYIGGAIFAQEQNSENTSQTPAENQINEDQVYRENYAQTLINFSELDPKDDKPTEIDYSSYLTSFTLKPEEVEQLKMSYALNSWKVNPRSSMKFPDVIKNSFVKAVQVKDSATKYAGENVLGARIAFPDYPFEMFAEIMPPFRANPDAIITDENGNPKNAFAGKGILNNVGVVRSAYITVYGLNQPERLYVVTEDVTGNEYEYSFGDLKFIGWKTLEWTNPNYLRDVRSRDVQSLPLYPQASSNRRLKAIKVVRSGNIYGGADFVTYVKDIKLTFDKAVDDELINRDIDNEQIWRIVKQRIGVRDSILYKRSLIERSHEYLENRKKYNYPDPADSSIQSTNSASDTQQAPASEQQDEQQQEGQ